MRKPGEETLAQAAMTSLARFIVGLAIPFLMAAGGVALAAWAMEADQEVLGIVGLCIAVAGFLWLFFLSAMFSGWDAEGEGVALSVYVIIGLIALGGGAAVILGAGLAMLALASVPVLIVIAIWGAISSGFSFFE